MRGCNRLLHKGVVKLGCLLCKLAVLLVCKFELALDGHITSAVPIRTEVLAEVLYRVKVIVSDHELTLCILHVTKIAGKAHEAVLCN